MKILIAEDDSTTRHLLAAMIDSSRYEPIMAEDGDQAWEILRRPDAPPLVILDWIMPGMEGIEVCRRIHALKPEQPPYVLMLTGRDDKDKVIEALESGADDYLVKPCEPAELRARLNVGRRMVEARAKLAEKVEELRRSEGRVQAKLNILLSPERDIGALALEDIIDVQSLQSLLDDFYKLTNLATAVIALDGKVLIHAGWQDICTKFHRSHPEACFHCEESDKELSAGVEAGAFKIYRCKNSMWDMVTPITVEGNHIGNLFLGQFFFEDEEPDYEAFRVQARRYGFDEAAYMAALARVPRLAREAGGAIMSFYAKFANMTSKLSYANIKLARAMAERDTFMADLRQRTDFLGTLLETIPVPVFYKDAGGRYLGANRTFEALYGISHAELIGKSVFDIAPRELAELYHTKDIEAMRSSGIQVYEAQIKDGHGRLHQAMFHKTPFLDAEGQIGGLVGAILDITERKHAEEGLRRSEARFRSYFDLPLNGIAITSPDKEWIDVNARLCSILGYARDEISHMTWAEMTHADDLAADVEQFEALLAGEIEQYQLEKRFIRKDGSLVWTSLAVGCARSSGGNVVYVVAVIEDITSRKLTEAREKLANEVLGRLNRPGAAVDTIHDILLMIKEGLGFDAVGIRLDDGGDFPYFQTSGFPASFVQEETHLCALDASGKPLCDARGKPRLACVCGMVLGGQSVPGLPPLTEGGSFWTNSTSELMAQAKAGCGLKDIRGRCNEEGYESVALIPLGRERNCIGLLQLNDRRHGLFTAEIISFLESLGSGIGIALSRKRADATLRESEERFQKLFSFNPTLIAISSIRENVFIEVNRAFLKTLKYTKEEVIGKSSRALGLFVDQEKHEQLALELGSKGKIRNRELQVKTKDGEIFTGLFSGEIVDNQGDKALLTVMVDITERKRMEEELWRREEEYRSLVASIPGVTYRCANDKHWTMSFVSEEVIALTGYPVQDFLGNAVRSFVDVIHPDDRSLVDNVTQVCLAKKKTFEIEYRLTRADGELVWVHEKGRGVFDAKGNLLYLNGVIVDISELKRLEHAKLTHEKIMRRNEKFSTLGALVASVAHEINNPNSVITMSVPFLRKIWLEAAPALLAAARGGALKAAGKLPPEQALARVDDMLGGIHRASLRIKRIVQLLRDYIREQPTELKHEPVNLNEVISSSIDMLGSRLKHATDRLSVKFAADPPTIKGDFQRLEQVFINLLVNACDALSDKAQAIEVSSEWSPVTGELRVVVRDEGKGMPEEVLGRIGEPLMTTKHDSGGTGLGVSISMDIVREHGGRILYDSVPGAGTTATVIFSVPHNHD